MKKVLLFVCVMVLALTGCMNGTAKKLIEEAKIAVTDGDYDAAQSYGELAIKEGCKDEELIRLVDVLKYYKEAKAQFDGGNIEEAKSAIEKIDNTDGTGMTAVVEKLSEEIQQAEAEVKAFDEKIEEVEKVIADGNYGSALEITGALLENEGLTEEQKKHILDLNKEAQDKKATAETPVSVNDSVVTDYPKGKAMLTEQEALAIAKTQIEILPSSRVSITLSETTYMINVETDYTYNGETSTDEVSCMIDALTGKVVGLAG